MNDAFWSVPIDRVLAQLETTSTGLTGEEAQKRLATYGPNRLAQGKRFSAFSLFLAQFTSPIVLILIGAACLSAMLHDPVDASIILAIIVVSAFLGFWQERGAARALEELLALVQIKTIVVRDGRENEAPVEEVVPGDVVVLSAGASVPGDCLILDSKNLCVDEATLTGETYAVEKQLGVLPADTKLAGRTNSLYMGTHVVSGTGRAVVARTGRNTEFGEISQRLRLRPPETEFERGVRRFGYFLMEITLLLVIGIFALNIYLQRPVLDSLLFAMALAVGLTPQLLPAIIAVNLAHGAKRMAQGHVLVRRLSSIENFGSMNIFCSDKTGTLTEGQIYVEAAVDPSGNASDKVLHYASINAFFETGFSNPIDDAIRKQASFDPSGYEKLGEVPYDFIRKRLSILVARDGARVLVTKGAIEQVLDVCSQAETAEGTRVPLDDVLESARQRFREFSIQGYRTLGVAYRELDAAEPITKEQEVGMVFVGLLVLGDPPKAGIADTIGQLAALGVALKMITGDNRFVAARVAEQVGLSSAILTGEELHGMSDEALVGRLPTVDVFAEVEPNQKERIIRALQKSGSVVGFMGDGINDATALHAADVGISVDGAVDVAKEAADIVLLKHDLNVLVDGVREGRRTFANTLKYVFMATSANFGNMFSMACASIILPFLPLLPKQVLLINLMTDFPEMTIATDTVDPEAVLKPRRWDVRFIRNFMLVFGVLSSVFDFLTFAVLLIVLRAGPEQVRTGWFLESVISATLIVLVIRSRRPCFKSRPSRYLLTATVLVVMAALLLPWTPAAPWFGFQPVPLSFLAAMGTIVAMYVISAEVVKSWFFKWTKS